ncbi:carbohydrate ABC transporter permease [Paenibacillus piri]|uniref:Sugar ABC transporter permease n=1 Tax=Paenibacillus piri TaxID=2547395 RepID=A0A4R5K895_9BACL|nr:sugar ABC transporter permease [Paenibacillus piri]TDF89438.1 sugar ABC transporter permease [Paenibacillus piri]
MKGTSNSEKMIIYKRLSSHRTQKMKNIQFGLLISVPAILIVLGIGLYPLLYSFILSFTDFRLLHDETSFVGLGNFIHLLKENEFWNALKVTSLITFFSIFFEFLLGLCIALTLTSITRGKNFFRTIFLLPMMLSPVVVGLMFRYMFNDEFGIINTVLLNIGLIKTPIPWLLQTNFALASIITLDIWAATPLVVILLYSGLINIPSTLYEAGKIDGTNPFQSFCHITVPLLKPIIFVTLIIRGMDVFRVFDSIYVLTAGGPANSTESLAMYLYRINWKSNEIGMASAGSYLMLLIMIIASLLLMKSMSVGRNRV